MIQEYETTELLEMAFLSFKGFPYELDRENPFKVKAIFKGDPVLMRDLLEEFWAGSKERALLNSFIQVKRALWIGGKYDKNFYAKRFTNNENKNEETETKLDKKRS
jgi:hypothetical protein